MDWDKGLVWTVVEEGSLIRDGGVGIWDEEEGICALYRVVDAIVTWSCFSSFVVYYPCGILGVGGLSMYFVVKR